MGALLTVITSAALAGGAVEGDLALTLPGPNLGPGPGARLLGEVRAPELAEDRIALGAEVDLRLPSSTRGTLDGPLLAEQFDWRAHLTVLGVGARAALYFGGPEVVHGRVGLAVGIASLSQRVEGPAGTTSESATTWWARPQGGVLIPAGPVQATVTGLVGVAPRRFLVAGAGTVTLAAAVGYRLPL